MVGMARDILSRESATDVQAAQRDALLPQRVEDFRRHRDGALPGAGIGLLRSDVEGNAVRRQAKRAGVHQQVCGKRDVAAELARQRPLGTRTVGQQTHRNACPGRVPSQLLQFLPTVARKPVDPSCVGGGNRGGLFDRVTERQPTRRNPQRQAILDLRGARDVEGGAGSGERADEFRRRIRLGRIVDQSVRQGALQLQIPVGGEGDIDHEHGRRKPRSLEKAQDALGWR